MFYEWCQPRMKHCLFTAICALIPSQWLYVKLYRYFSFISFLPLVRETLFFPSLRHTHYRKSNIFVTPPYKLYDFSFSFLLPKFIFFSSLLRLPLSSALSLAIPPSLSSNLPPPPPPPTPYFLSLFLPPSERETESSSLRWWYSLSERQEDPSVNN